MAIVVSGIIFIFVVVFIVICRKYRQEKLQKKHAIETAQALSQWTKKIIIERQQTEDCSFSGILTYVHLTLLLESIQNTKTFDMVFPCF